MNRRASRLLAFLLGAIAVLAGAASSAGVFLRGDGAFTTVTSPRGETYEMATDGVYAYNALRVVAEGIGWDIFTLMVAVPALLLIAVFVSGGSFRARLAAAGMLGYFAYMYLEYSVTWAFGPLFPLFIVICAASPIGIVWIGASLATDGLAGRFGARFPRRSWALLSIGMSALLTVMWAGRIAQGLSGEVGGLLHGETTLTIQALDLGIVVPASVLIAVGALRGIPAAMAAAAAFAITFAAMSTAIAAMLVSAALTTGALELPPIVIFAGATTAGIFVSRQMYRSVETTVVAREDAVIAGEATALLTAERPAIG